MSPIVPQKRCSKCNQLFDATSVYFYTHHGDKLRAACIACTTKSNKAYNKTPAGHIAIKKGEIVYSHTEHGKEKKRLKAANYRLNHPEKERARKAVSTAVRFEKLPRIKTLSCLHCGKQANTYHHHSYEPEYWLDVIPLCRKCHTKVHAK